MYNSFFGLTETPFNLTPDPRYLFLSPNHREAIDHLLYGINERKGFILITGSIGAGKTTLCRVLLERLDNKTKSALILNSFISDIELLKLIVQEFGVDIDSDRKASKKDYIDALNLFLLENFGKGGNAVLLIDEAQNLSRDVLEQLRMLSNLETEREKLIQIVLIGQPELNDIIGAPSLRQLNDRIVVRYFLKPLGYSDLKGYVEHRLVVAGSHGNINFTDRAYKRLYTRSNGIPRRINSICDRALLIAFTKETHTITGKTVEKAAEDLYGIDTLGKKPGNIFGLRPVYIIPLIIIFIAAVIAGFGNRDSLLKLADSHGGKDVKATVKEKVIEEKNNPAKVTKAPGMFLDDKDSITQLFAVFYKNYPSDMNDEKISNLSVVNFELAPEYYIMLKKPFRLKTLEKNSADKYLLITSVSDKGAVCLDSEGSPREITKEFLFKNWGGTVSWIFPVYQDDQIIKLGMKDPDVFKMQKTLLGIGYMVRITGIYDITTFNEMKHFQSDFGLSVDGAAGPVTRALLYQMAE